MLTREDDVDAHKLHAKGWTISASARHLGHEACRPVKGRPVAVIEHPPGEETQFDWVELPDPPASWGWGPKALLFVGALSHSSRWRGRLAESMDQPHAIDGLDRVTRELGGLTDVWRFDRMATVCYPATGKITASFAAVVKHYGVGFVTCPPRRGNHKGVVEKAIHSAAQRWWRTLGDDVTVEQAQASLDRLCVTRFDQRPKVIDGTRATVADHAGRERLRPVPAVAFPATISVQRRVTANGQVAHQGNFYSVPPELFHSLVTVTERLGDAHIDIAVAGGTVIARHHRAGDGSGVLIADHGHVTALNTAASPRR